ncbi:MAG: glycerol-3-phosphate dehydrogenase subunit GlpB [Caldilineales bacterium]|nr:glycerol-3-phosphate dehydrogenase subunit GlpB [Caldilineales bacterium]
MLDLLVIGAGLSGMIAASAAARAGLNVRVIAKGLGALHWGAGTIDVLGYLPGEANGVQRPLQKLEPLASNWPDHPYAFLGSGAVAKALADFQELTVEIGLPYAGDENDDNMLLPSPVGATRPVFLAPAAQRAGDLRRSEPMLVVGFDGLRDFYPHLIAENLCKQGHAARALSLPLDLITSRRDYNTVHLAQALDSSEVRPRLADEIGKRVRSGERVGLPAILGLNDHAVAFAGLANRIGLPLFEIPTLPPSVPGIRLFNALRRHLDQLGVRVEIGMEAIAFDSTSTFNLQSLTSVQTATSARPLRHRARVFLLATGGILGGGIATDHTGKSWETIFDLPLTIPNDRAQWFRPLALDPAGHPVFRGGVCIDGRMQPLGDDGQPIYDNLWAAGGILTGADAIRERSREGIDIATGRAAAQGIIAYLQT